MEGNVKIGIARALYKGTNILVFDEATSALDNKTEMDLINSINKLSEECTIISIAIDNLQLQIVIN